MQLFALQVEYGFMLSLKWFPTAENGVADAISWPSRNVIVHIAPAAFRAIWDEMGSFNVHLMAWTASVLRFPVSGEILPFFSQYYYAGSAGTGVFAQGMSNAPGTTTPAFGFCFPPRSWQVTLRNIWRNAQLMLSSFCQMSKRIGSLWCSSPQ